MIISLESKFGSADIARVATRLATTTTREEEMEYRSELQSMNIHAAAVDFGGPVDKIKMCIRDRSHTLPVVLPLRTRICALLSVTLQHM